ncbi:MAG: PaaX family transcriptional regulator C-terminal domain-containing protein [Acidimicrobiales bacterium]
MSRPTPHGLPARSIIASTLLGTHPPRMPGRLLVAITKRFGVSEGTARVALSRMVDKGELTNEDGNYVLAGPLLERQGRQDAARRRPRSDWSGVWQVAIVVGPPSGLKHRQDRRLRLQRLKLGELREGVWLRPDNLDLPRPEFGADVLFSSARLEADPVELAAELWVLDQWADEARTFVAGLAEATVRLDRDDDDRLLSGFVLSAAVLRHLLADPELPRELWPPDWPGPALRDVYDSFDEAYRRLLRRFFAAEL